MKKILLSVIIAITTVFTVTAQFNKMVIGDNNNGRIVISNLNGTNITPLTSTLQSFYSADVDPINQKIYMAWYYGIYRMDYDGSNFDTLINYSGDGYSSGIAVDAINGFLYWASTPEKKIYRSDLNGANSTTIHTANGYLGGIDIDITNNKLFFGQNMSSPNNGVFSIDLDGSNLTQITSNGADLINLDKKNNKIYYAENSTTKRIDYNGSNDTIIFNFQSGGFFIDTANSILYTSDMTNNNIVKSNLNGENPVNIFADSILDAPFGPLFLSVTTTGIIDIHTTKNEIIVYPNPANNQINFSVYSNIQLTNTMGQIVAVKKNVNSLDLSNQPSGIYSLTFTDNNGQIIQQSKIVKE